MTLTFVWRSIKIAIIIFFFWGGEEFSVSEGICPGCVPRINNNWTNYYNKYDRLLIDRRMN